MRVENWHAKEVFGQIADEALKSANEVMDDHAAAAKLMCPVGTITREGGFVKKEVSFIPSKGRNKGKPVSFIADTWTGRKPGSLRNSIRRVNKPSRPGNIRVYAGNFKVYYARFVEYGTAKTRPQPFMRPSFNAIRNKIISRIKAGIKKVPEVK